MEPKRSASINFRQAIGVLVFMLSCLVGFSVILSFVINMIRINIDDSLSWPEVVGVIVAIVICLVFTAALFGFSFFLLNDPKGYDWKRTED